MNSRKTFIDLIRSMLPAKDDSLMLASTEDYNGQKSIAISIKDITKQIDEELFSILSIGSMAYEDICNYAKKDHDHDIYTSADYIQTGYGNNLSNFLSIIQSQKNPQILKVNVDKTEDDKREQIEAIISAAQPKLGEIRHLALNSISNPDYESSAFNGWVLANGDTYQLSDFKLSNDISNVFYTSGTNFKVPNLSNFCKINVALSASSYDITNAKVHIKNHTHETDIISAKVYIKNVTNITRYDDHEPKFYCYSKSGSGKFMPSKFAHHGKGKHYSVKCSCYNDIKSDVFNNSGLQTLPMNNIIFNYLSDAITYIQTEQDIGKKIAIQPINQEKQTSAYEVYEEDNNLSLRFLYEGQFNDISSEILPETYPSHNFLPTFVYIGPGKNTQPYFEP